VWLAYRTRNVTDNFNESKSIGIAIGNSIVSAAFLIPISLKIYDYLPDSAAVLLGIFCCYTPTFALLAVYGKRLWLIFNVPAGTQSELFRDSELAQSMLRSDSGNTGDLSAERHADLDDSRDAVNDLLMENEVLRDEVRRLSQHQIVPPTAVVLDLPPAMQLVHETVAAVDPDEAAAIAAHATRRESSAARMGYVCIARRLNAGSRFVE
jgi:hypothetical protein